MAYRRQNAVMRWLIPVFTGMAMFDCSLSLFAADLGASVSNIATASHGPVGARTTIETSPATFTILPLRTPSTIEFFRHGPAAPDADLVALNGSDFSSDGGVTFSPVGNLVGPSGSGPDFSVPVPLVSAVNYFGGEIIFVRVEDVGQNGNSSSVETISATVSSGTGDEIILRLYESGPATGVFFGYFETSRNATPVGDSVLSIAQGEELVATYQDPFDASEISTDIAGVDPFGRVFDSVTGALIDGAEVTIVDAATGLPAEVFGIDGVSVYPSTITSGTTVTDESGLAYDLEPGEFVFPIMFPGDYRLVIVPPASYRAPSLADPADIALLPGGPFTIAPASFLDAFVLNGTGDVSFDVPLDPETDLTVTKSVSTQTAAIGDFVRYSIAVENNADTATLLNVIDQLPRGFRYQAGSAKRDGVTLDEPLISPDALTLTFAGGVIDAQSTSTISYVVEVGAGSRKGEAINSAYVANGAGSPLSNIAQAATFVEEDLFRSHLTVVGRVAANACSPEDQWPRKIHPGQSVANIRLYLETGAYATTDEDGLFHFEHVEPKRHVIQIDEESIPAGFEPVLCEENTRTAGSAISQFIDAQGGSVWRANFYLKETGAPSSDGKIGNESGNRADNLAYKDFDLAWLNSASNTAEFVYPADGKTPSARSIHIGIKHPNFTRVTLLVNGAKAPALNFSGREVNDARTIALSRWRGVDLVEGKNNFVGIIMDDAGNEVDRIERELHFVSEASRAVFLPDASTLEADGLNAPSIAVRITDGAGRPVHKGRQIRAIVDAPYRLLDKQRLEDSIPLTAPNAASSYVAIGDDGIAHIKLEPTLQTGSVSVSVVLDDEKHEDFTAFLTPALRDWIVVGLAEGGLSYSNDTQPSAPPRARDLLRDGRIAVFAKGTVKGDWLVTAAVDTDKTRGSVDDQVFDDVDPDERYAIFGDRSRQEFEAQSRYPVFLKAEKGEFQATLGDYDAGLTETKLGRYARRLSGLQTLYEGKRLRFRGFAAETNQQFIRDELAADGTSGPFQLSTVPLVVNGETLTIETRNRFRPDEIIETTPLTRYLDYDIDFRTGEFILRLPVPAAPDANGFNVIVAEYETQARGERNIVAGGRGAVRLANDRAELGLTVIHEAGSNAPAQVESDLASVDLRVDVSDTTQLRFEYGMSRHETLTGREDADAISAELRHVSGSLTGRAYYDEIEAGFGLGQQSSGVAGVRRIGGEARLKIQEFYAERTGEKGERAVSGEAYTEENLLTGARRFVASLKIRHDGSRSGAAVGLRRIVEETADGVKRRAALATTEIRQRFEKIGLTIRASHDQPIGSDDESIQFPQRTTFGFEQTLFDNVRLDVSHEISQGDNVQSTNTIVGIVAEPWGGSRLSAAADRITQDSGERLGATFGVDQQVQIDTNWMASFGVSRRQEIATDGTVSEVDDIIPDRPVSPLEDSQDFTSVYAGLGFREEGMQASARFELKKTQDSTRYTGVLGAAREVSETLSFAGAMRLEQNDNNDAPNERSMDTRIGIALRPRDNGMIIFNRLDIRHEKTVGDLTSWKAINNLGINGYLSRRWQMSLNHGVKYTLLDANNESYSGVTQLAGLETRYDLSEHIDIGARVMALYSHNSRTMEYSFGPSIGINPADNIWLSAGWNFEGFTDDDFAFADYTRSGPFIRVRIKFDQNTAAGLLNEISPN